MFTYQSHLQGCPLTIYLSERLYIGLSTNQSLSLCKSVKKKLKAHSQESAKALENLESLLIKVPIVFSNFLTNALRRQVDTFGHTTVAMNIVVYQSN